MKLLCDVNLLLYAHHDVFPLHEPARRWLGERLSGEGIAIPWTSLLGFLRLSVKRGVLPKPVAVNDAWTAVERMLDTERVWLAEPMSRHRHTLARLLPLVGGQGDDITDAHLAALAIEHNLTLATTDTGFARFEPAGLRWRNPLSP